MLAVPTTEAARFELPKTWSQGTVEAMGASITVGNPAAAPPLTRWWVRFNDPMLDRLVADAMRANNTVLSAHAALQQARALRDVTAATLWPTLDASAGIQKSRSGGNSNSPVYRVGLDASWELDLFGRNRSALTAAEAAQQASLASLGDIQVSIAAEVAIAYITLRGSESRLSVANQNLASQDETLQITKWRQQAGLVTTLEIAQATALRAQTAAQQASLGVVNRQARFSLAVLTGVPPAALNSLLVPSGVVPMPSAMPTLLLPIDAMRQRPDVRAAEFQVTAARARTSQAMAARLPNFQLTGSIGYSALSVATLTNSASLVSAIAAAVAAPLFDGGNRHAQVRVQQALLEQAALAYQVTLLNALKEVENALAALHGDRIRLDELTTASSAAAEASLLARQRFSSGLIDFQTVLDSLRTQLGAEDSLASARADVSADHVRLFKALGGGWDASSDVESPVALGSTRRIAAP
jgi:NodT family efflux transporter outer membrane factor (OMF) lipoprotein